MKNSWINTVAVASLLFAFAQLASAKSPATLDELRSSLVDLGYNQGAAISAPSNVFFDSGVGNSSNSSIGCTITCDILSRLLPNITSQLGSTAYTQQEAAYWSIQQANTQPTCRTQPQSALDVAATVLITKFFKCQFAVKSGGHAAFVGASNIQNGLTIDLANLNEVQVSDDRTLTSVGAGNRWVDVYSKLDPQQLSVIGGRVADIGVGGLTLGGGISFFSGRHGWACDNVRNYQVVLASGQIADINLQSNPDLYFALRGGGNNFGIVTRFDLETFPQGDLWGGSSFYPITANASLLTALSNFATNAPTDPDAAAYLAFVGFGGQYLIYSELTNAKPIANPPILQEFTAIESLSSNISIQSLTTIVTESAASSPSGFRELYTTVTSKVSTALQAHILDTFIHEIEAIKDAEGIVPALVMQPITVDVISHFSQAGGNALGIAESDGPFILTNLAIYWSSPSDDARIRAAANRIIDDAVSTAEGMGLDFRYIYQNYASANQDVFAGYGAANQERLREISRKYDPEGVFQKLQPGYFKVG